MHAAILCLAALCVAGFASGCSVRSTQSGNGAAAPKPTASRPQAVVSAMTIEQKRDLLAQNFQAEVPVPMGEVVRAEAQGDTAWDYEIVVAAQPAVVANWYEETYRGREWEVVDQTSPSPGALTLTLMKNAAQTRVAITPEGSGAARVKGVLGVGAPVLQQQ